MGYETIYGGKEPHPDWMTQSRTYPLLNASGGAMSDFIRERREQEEEQGEADAPEAG